MLCNHVRIILGRTDKCTLSINGRDKLQQVAHFISGWPNFKQGIARTQHVILLIVTLLERVVTAR